MTIYTKSLREKLHDASAIAWLLDAEKRHKTGAFNAVESDWLPSRDGYVLWVNSNGQRVHLEIFKATRALELFKRAMKLEQVYSRSLV